MSSVKERMIAIVNDQPDDSSFDEILRELAFDRMIQRGLDDADNGRVISNEEMKKKVERLDARSRAVDGYHLRPHRRGFAGSGRSCDQRDL